MRLKMLLIPVALVCLCIGQLEAGLVTGITNVVEHISEDSVINDLDGCLDTLSTSWEPSPDANLTTPELITKYGYPVETHKVTTKDGYILTMFRIPNGRYGESEQLPYATKPVALLEHGLLCSSSDWLMNTVDKALAYILADAGYDVWIGNARGTNYSQEHVNLTTDDLRYWNFSWHQMGQFDIPAEIDYILEQTGEPKLYYLGHSMGTTRFWVAMSLYPEYNKKIRSMYALSPVAYLGNMLSPLGLLAPFAVQEEWAFDKVGKGQFLPQFLLEQIHSVGPIACGPAPLALAVCGNAFFAIAGIDPCQFNTTQQVSNIVGHTPDSISSRTIIHYLQLKNSRKFRRYDYGPIGNKQAYGQLTPPDYDLSKVTAKVAGYWGQNDILSVPQDVFTLKKQLPNLIEFKRVEFDLFNHLDFTYAKDINYLLYDQVLQTMSANYD